MEEIVVAIDIGTSKVCSLIGRINKANQLEVMGKSLVPCNGVKKGVIVDIESTSGSIRSSVEQAESMAGLKVGSAYVNIAGMHVSVINNRSWTNISSQDREISREDVEKLLYAVQEVQIPEDRQIIDVVPRQYIIDGYDEIVDPVGMVGVRLEVEADVIAGRITSVQNIVKALRHADIEIDGIVAGAFATGEMVLSAEDREIGVIVIDTGGGITDISVFKNDRLIFYDSIPVGGDHITNDISIGLKISFAEAEKIKKQYELALTSIIKNDQTISVYDANDNSKKNVRISEVVEIIEARVYEIFSLCDDLLRRANLEGNYGAGVVLTGGGISHLEGNRQIAGEVFGLPVRVASCNVTGASKPEFITAAGMIKYLSGSARGRSKSSEVRVIKVESEKKELTIFRKLSKFINELF